MTYSPIRKPFRHGIHGQTAAGLYPRAVCANGLEICHLQCQTQRVRTPVQVSLWCGNGGQAIAFGCTYDRPDELLNETYHKRRSEAHLGEQEIGVIFGRCMKLDDIVAEPYARAFSSFNVERPQSSSGARMNRVHTLGSDDGYWPRIETCCRERVCRRSKDELAFFFSSLPYLPSHESLIVSSCDELKRFCVRDLLSIRSNAGYSFDSTGISPMRVLR